MSLLWLTTALYLATAHDGCQYGGQVRCGDQCGGQCQCGDQKEFSWTSDLWCCLSNNSSCTVYTNHGFKLNGVPFTRATCETGKVQPLSQPCNGQCNTYLEDPNRGERTHLLCQSGDQCVKEVDLCQGVLQCEDKLDIGLCKLDHWRGRTCPQGTSRYTRCNGSIPGQCVANTQWGDGRYDCLDRDDETGGEKNKKALDWALMEEMKECQGRQKSWEEDVDSGLGLECGEKCLEYYGWCSTDRAYTCPQLGMRTTNDPDICGNNTFWEGRTCQYKEWIAEEEEEGRRCNGANPGQCSYNNRPDSDMADRPCADGSEQVNRLPSLCPDPALLVYNTHTHPHCTEWCQCTGGKVMCNNGDCIYKVTEGGGKGGGGERGG